MPVKSTSSVSLAAMPVAGQVPGTGERSRVLTANTRMSSGVVAGPSASEQERAPEQYCLVPLSRQPPPVLLAVSPGPGGCAAQTPQRLPAGGGSAPSSARIARASACPSASRGSERSATAAATAAPGQDPARSSPISGSGTGIGSTESIISTPSGLLRCPPPDRANPGERERWPRRRTAAGSDGEAFL